MTDSRKDPFVKYHVKQGLLLFIGWIAVAIIGAILAMVSWRLWIIVRLLNAVIFVLMILGIISASQGHQKPLPLIGKFGEMFKF